MKKLNLGLWVFIIIGVGILCIPIPVGVRVILFLSFILSFLFYRRNILYFLNGNRILRNGKDENCWPWFERALKAHIAADGQVSIGSMYVQYGDMARGKKILEEYLSEPKKKANANLDSIAKIILALVVKCEGNEEKAIEMLQVVKASGYKNISLSLDLITLYLDLNEIDKAKAEWEEVKDQEGQNIALDSCYGRLLLVTGEYQKAYELFSDLVKKPARLVSTFVHCAQCFIHFGQVKEALSALQVASKCVFNHTSPFTKETVEGMYLALKDPKTRIATAKAMDRNIDVIARGGAFTPIENSYPPCDADRLEGFDTLRPKIERKQKAERLPNTEITEEDETYLKTHHIEETK